MASVVVAASGKDMENIWPCQIEDDYERIKPIGKGGFGIVWLAKARNRKDEKVDNDGDDSIDTFKGKDSFGPKPIGSGRGDSPAFVTIKQITALKEEARQYTAHEVAILSEVNHLNIVRCLRYVEMPRSQLVVMTFADGPTLGNLVIMISPTLLTDAVLTSLGLLVIVVGVALIRLGGIGSMGNH
jgi:serine/threonine protein kinase